MKQVQNTFLNNQIKYMNYLQDERDRIIEGLGDVKASDLPDFTLECELHVLDTLYNMKDKWNRINTEHINFIKTQLYKQIKTNKS